MWLPGLVATDSSFQTAGTTVTAHATPHTKGSWVELVASVPFDVTMIGVASADNTNASATDTSQLTDIGVGANPDEKVVIANVPSGYSAIMVQRANVVWFPVEIPSGTRLSARMQATITVDTVDIQLLMYGNSSWSSTPQFQSVDTIGALTASSHGTNLNGGGIVEIIASTTEDYKALGVSFDGAGATSINGLKIVEVFVGAGAAEKTLIDNIHVTLGATEIVQAVAPTQGILPMEMNIPSGSRLSATSLASGSLGLVIYGFR